MGKQKIVTVEKNTGVPRKPFQPGEKERHFALLAQQVIALDADQAKVKERKDAIDRIKADIVAGGYVDDAQTALPIFDEDDEQAANGNGEQQHAET